MDLDRDISAYDSPNYHFFWGGHCSQWMISPFTEFNTEFNTAEQFMMAAKAKLFGDDEIYEKIMAEKDPAEQKKLGRQVKNFDNKEWVEVARDYVTLGNYNKFTQNPEYLNFLKSHADCFFVEASPYDRIWGIGVGVGTPGISNPNNWNGLNWLGECINEARDMILLEVRELADGTELNNTKSQILRQRLDWNK